MDEWCRNKIRKYPAFSLVNKRNIPKKLLEFVEAYFSKKEYVQTKTETLESLLIKRIHNEIDDNQLYNFLKEMSPTVMTEDHRITLALTAYRKGKFKEAINILKQGEFPSKLIMARMFLAQKMYKKALKILRNIKNCRYASSIKIYCLLKLGKYELAMNEIQQIKKINYSWEILIYEAKILAEREKKYKKAIELLKEAIKLAPVSFVYFYSAKIAAKAGYRKLAEQFLYEGGKYIKTRDEYISFLKTIVKIGTRSSVWHSAACVIGYLHKNYTLLGLVQRDRLTPSLQYIYDLAYFRADPYKASTARAQCKNWIEKAAYILMI